MRLMTVLVLSSFSYPAFATCNATQLGPFTEWSKALVCQIASIGKVQVCAKGGLYEAGQRSNKTKQPVAGEITIDGTNISASLSMHAFGDEPNIYQGKIDPAISWQGSDYDASFVVDAWGPSSIQLQNKISGQTFKGSCITQAADPSLIDIATAIRDREWEYVKDYVEKMPNINAPIFKSTEPTIFRTLLTYGAPLDLLEFMLKKGASIEDPEKKRIAAMTLLPLVLEKDQSEYRIAVYRLLLRYHADINYASGDEAMTVFLREIAFMYGQPTDRTKVLRFLVQNGANPNARDNGGCGAFFFIVGNDEAQDLSRWARELIAVGADPNLLDDAGHTAAQDLRIRKRDKYFPRLTVFLESLAPAKP